MGILSGVLGNASEVSIDKLQEEYQPILVQNEKLEKAYKIIRDMFIFTNKRIIFVDKQGLTGTKVEYLSVPYKNIIRFAKESAGILDLDAELKIWVTGQTEPITKEFKKDNNINEVYQMISHYILQ